MQPSRSSVKRVGFILVMLSGFGTPPLSQAAPDAASAEQNFYAAVFKTLHPNVDGPRLLELGYQACMVRRSGGSSDDAKVSSCGRSMRRASLVRMRM